MITETVTPRLAPLEPPFDPEVDAQLSKMMPPGVPPIALFRTFVRNLPMTEAMGTWGAYELSRKLSLSMREREIVVDRPCARCGCEYEWGVHVAFFAERAGLDQNQIVSLTTGGADDDCWSENVTGCSSTQSTPFTTMLISPTRCGRPWRTSLAMRTFSISSSWPAGTTPSALWPGRHECPSNRAHRRSLRSRTGPRTSHEFDPWPRPTLTCSRKGAYS